MEHTLNKSLFIILPNLIVFFWEKDRRFILVHHIITDIKGGLILLAYCAFLPTVILLYQDKVEQFSLYLLFLGLFFTATKT